MNNIINPKRFWNYLLYDLKNAASRIGLSLVICAAMPFFVFAVVEALSLMITGGTTVLAFEVRLVTIFLMLFVCSVFIPTRLYGKLTDKRYGSDFILLPASVTEKFSSLLVVLCVAVPVVFSAVTLVVDLLMGLCFNKLYGDPILMSDCSVFFGGLIDGRIGINFFFVTLMSWFEYVILFALGAMIFKRSKIVKTFLASFALGMVFTTFLSIVSRNFLMEINDAVPEDVFHSIKVFMYVTGSLITLVYAGLLYLRMKTIKL